MNARTDLAGARAGQAVDDLTSDLQRLRQKARAAAEERFSKENGGIGTGSAWHFKRTKLGKARLAQLLDEELAKRRGQAQKLERSRAHAVSQAAEKPYWLYLLECHGGTFYAGVAADVEARFNKHVFGTGARYTRAFPPIRVAAARCYPSKGEALSAEYELKQRPRAEKLQFFDLDERAESFKTM